MYKFIPQSLLPPLLGGACAPAQNIFVRARVGEVVRGEGDAVAAMLQEDLPDRAPRTRAAARLKQHGGLLDQLLWGIGP